MRSSYSGKVIGPKTSTWTLPRMFIPAPWITSTFVIVLAPRGRNDFHRHGRLPHWLSMTAATAMVAHRGRHGSRICIQEASRRLRFGPTYGRLPPAPPGADSRWRGVLHDVAGAENTEGDAMSMDRPS